MLALLLLVSNASAQTDLTFTSGVSSVRIDAQVLQGADLVTDLTAKDFVILEEGKPQPIVYFGRESEPLALILLLDISGSMRNNIEQVASVARQSLSFLRPGDRVAVMPFARRTKVSLEFTDDKAAVAQEIRASVTDDSLGAGTALNEAVSAATKYANDHAGETGRRAILIITDNLGLNYQTPDDAVLDELNRANVVLNALVSGESGKPPKTMPPGVYQNPDFTPFNVFRLAEESGGESVKTEKASAAFPRMIERIRTRYSIHFNKPPGIETGYRNVSVSLTPEARLRYKDVVIRARKGYFNKS